jgi:hypothetical protein
LMFASARSSTDSPVAANQRFSVAFSPPLISS